MKPLLDLLTTFRPHFTKGGRFGAAEPIYEATESLLFAPSTRTPGAAHVRDPLDVKRFMSMVMVAVAPCVLMGLYFFGIRVLFMIAVSYAAGGAVEVGIAMLRKEEINEGFLVTGLLFPLVLPPALPLWLVALGSAVGVLLGKELFGGTGRNLFNPALVGRCFLALSYPAALSGNWVMSCTGLWGRTLSYVDARTTDVVTNATPLVMAKKGVILPIDDMFLGRTAGCVGETSTLAIIIGGVLLILVGVANWRTVVATLGSFTIVAGVLGLVFPETFGATPVLWHLFAGGLMFGAFFMVTDPVTAPITDTGKWCYGALVGALTVLIRNLTGYVEGVMFAILLGNICAPVMDEMVVRFRLRRLRNER